MKSHETCPICKHNDCFSYSDIKYHCFSCGAKPSKNGPIRVNGVLIGSYNETKEEEECVDLVQYIPDSIRGITKKTMESDNLTYVVETEQGKVITFVYPGAEKYRNLDLPKKDPKHFWSRGTLDKLQGIDKPKKGKICTITEGEFDRLSVIQMMGNWDVYNVPGSTPSQAFWVNTRKDLSNFEKIILSVDKDESGDKLAEKFYKIFPGKVYRVDHGEYKDANDFLQAGKVKEYTASWWDAKKVKPDNILSTAEDYKNLYNNTADYEYFESGIPELDQKMLGIHKGAVTLILAQTGIGKSLAPETPVIKYDGSVVRADEVKVGDKLLGPDSKVRNVTNVNFQSGKMYKITPIKGEPFKCNEDHIMSLRHTSTGEITNVVLKDYLNWSKTQKHLWKLWRTGVDFPAIGPNNPSLAYCVGAYLGDGRVQGPEISMGKKKEPVFDYMINSGYLKPSSIKFRQNAYYIGFSRKSFLWDYLSNKTGQSEDCLTVRKIPHEMKVGHTETRKAVLSGLLDTDGSLTTGGAEITQKSETLSDDICFVARSLGLAAYKKLKVVNGEPYYRVSISGDLTILPCKRLKFKPRRQIKNVLNTGFTVEDIGDGIYRGIALDGDHLFLLGDFTVTHNSEFMRYLENQCLKNSDYKFGYCHLEETKLRSVLGLVSYDLGKNATRKGLVGQEEVFSSMERISEGERAVHFSIEVGKEVPEIVEEVKFLNTVMEVDYVFLEPIQDLVTGSTTDKESLLSDLINQLKRLAAELNIGVVIIAHANEDGDAKYCKSIVQGAAYEIVLERDMESDDELESNTTYIKVGRKNRTGGGSGPAGSMLFDLDSYTLRPNTEQVGSLF